MTTTSLPAPPTVGILHYLPGRFVLALVNDTAETFEVGISVHGRWCSCCPGRGGDCVHAALIATTAAGQAITAVTSTETDTTASGGKA